MSASCKSTRRLMHVVLGEAFANVIIKELWKKDPEEKDSPFHEGPMEDLFN